VSCPLSFETLVSYWAADLPAAEVDAIDEHLFECGACFACAGRVAALATGMRHAVPPISVERDLERARARGVVIEGNDFRPDVPKEAWMRRGVDVLVHRLVLADPDAFEQASVVAEALDGTPLFTFSDVPIDRESGAVLVACQRHFRDVVPDPDMRFRVRGSSASGARSEESFTVLHRYE
jgi:hypothetical protein